MPKVPHTIYYDWQEGDECVVFRSEEGRPTDTGGRAVVKSGCDGDGDVRIQFTHVPDDSWLTGNGYLAGENWHFWAAHLLRTVPERVDPAAVADPESIEAFLAGEAQ